MSETSVQLSGSAHSKHVPHSHEHKPAISKRWKWATVLGNAAIGVAEVIFGNTSALSVTADGIHNGGDAISYHMQADNELKREKYSEEKLKKRRKFGHWVIALGSGLVAAKAGLDIVADQETEHSQFGLYAAAASLSLNGLLWARLEKGIRRKKKAERRRKKTTAENDLSKHMWGIDMPSAVLATLGATAQKFNIGVEQYLAVTSGTLGAYLFRPTEANLAHDHSHELEDLEDGHHCGHEHDHHHEGRRLNWREKLSSHVWATGSYLTGRARSWAEKLADKGAEKSGLMRKAKLGMMAVAGVAVGAVAWRVSQGAIDPSVIAENATSGLADAAPRPEVIPDVPIPEVRPPSPSVPETVLYSPEAKTITPGEGWNLTYEQMNIDAEHWSELLDRASGRLSEMEFSDGTSVAYFQELDTPAGGEWRMNMSPGGKMPDKVLDYLSDEAKLLAAR